MTRPEKGTPEYALWVAAIEVATAAPLERSNLTGDAKVPWPTISELRAALDAVGIDWRKAKTARDAVVAERRRIRQAERDEANRRRNADLDAASVVERDRRDAENAARIARAPEGSAP